MIQILGRSAFYIIIIYVYVAFSYIGRVTHPDIQPVDVSRLELSRDWVILLTWSAARKPLHIT